MGISDIVTTRAGDQDSMDKLMIAYKDKLLPKDDLTQVLRAFQTAKNAITSKNRDLARAIFGYRETYQRYTNLRYRTSDENEE